MTERLDLSHGAAHQGAGKMLAPGRWRPLALGVVLLLTTAVFGKQVFDHFHIPAYGDAPEELARLRDADPRSLSGDDLTTLRDDYGAFGEAVSNIDWRLALSFDKGDGHFERAFREASPSSYGSNGDGVGPIYNARSCDTCHFKDGRAEPKPGQSLLVRLSVPGQNAHGGAKGHPVYGGQFGDVAIGGVPAEGRVDVRYEEIAGTYGDGTPYTLLKPVITLQDLAYGPLGPEVMTSVRTAPAMHGLGLLEAIPDSTLEGWADPDDRDGDGISGRPNIVWDPEHQTTRIGRFGWKAETPSIVVQSADAANNDMGVTSPIVPDSSCTAAQTACLAARTGADPETPHEMTAEQLDEIRIYLSLLAVPARGHLDDPRVTRGEELFNGIGCANCHKPQAETGTDHDIRRLRGKLIQPFTDLLLHDMGEGLSDHRQSFASTGSEWRTAPLWGIGLVETVNGHTRFLHDGRARGFAEAILWHGGEAETARETFRNLEAADREAILTFLKSL